MSRWTGLKYAKITDISGMHFAGGIEFCKRVDIRGGKAYNRIINPKGARKNVQEY